MNTSRVPKNIEQYKKHYTEPKLFSKIGKVFRKAGMKAIYYVLLLYYVLKDSDTPIKHKAIILGALGYFILPADLLPDIIPLLGFTDDIAALAACIKAVMENVTPAVRQKAIQRLSDWFSDVQYSEVEKYDSEI